MMGKKIKIVLVDGVETYTVAGHGGPIHLGHPVEVDEELAHHLLGQRCGQGRKMFVECSEMDNRRVALKLTDPSQTYYAGVVFAQNAAPIEVAASLVPFLLSLRREGVPVFVRAEADV
jgi:hypothetical protein